jgi:hypothetical protein
MAFLLINVLLFTTVALHSDYSMQPTFCTHLGELQIFKMKDVCISQTGLLEPDFLGNFTPIKLLKE